MYGHLASTPPTVSMRVDKLKLPGKEGGCAAVEIEMEDVLAGVQREVLQQPVDEGDKMAALADLKGFSQGRTEASESQGLSARKRAR